MQGLAADTIVNSIHEILAQPQGSLALTRASKLEDLGINSLAFIKICFDLENKAGIDLTNADELTKPETLGDILDLAAALGAV